MVKIKCSIKDKSVLLGKTSDLVTEISDIRNYYYNISVPSDFGYSSKLSYIEGLLSDIKNNANLINESLDKYLYKMEEIQADLLDSVSEIPVDSLLLFNNEWQDRSHTNLF